MRTDEINLRIKKTIGKNLQKILIRLIFPWRNHFILFNVSNRAKKCQVNLNYWDEAENLGDLLSPVVVNYMLSLKNISPTKKVSKCKHLYAIGSVLTAGIQDTTVWGSGVLNANISSRLEKRTLDVRAVRGPLTRVILMDYNYDVPEIYGDPAILLPEIYTPVKIKEHCKYGLILHKDYGFSKTIEKLSLEKNIKRLDIRTDDYRRFINEITSVSVIISSSLHGIILAEAYNIPAILLKPKNDTLKYFDYYYSTNRFYFPIAQNLNEALETTPPPLPALTDLRAKLKDNFPYDLYEQE